MPTSASSAAVAAVSAADCPVPRSDSAATKFTPLADSQPPNQSTRLPNAFRAKLLANLDKNDALIRHAVRNPASWWSPTTPVAAETTSVQLASLFLSAWDGDAEAVRAGLCALKSGQPLQVASQSRSASRNIRTYPSQEEAVKALTEAVSTAGATSYGNAGVHLADAFLQERQAESAQSIHLPYLLCFSATSQFVDSQIKCCPTLVHAAIYRGHSTVAEMLVVEGGLPAAIALAIAVDYGQLAMAQSMVSLGGQLSSARHLSSAVRNGDLPLTRWLIAQGLTPTRSQIEQGAIDGDMELLALLLDTRGSSLEDNVGDRSKAANGAMQPATQTRPLSQPLLAIRTISLPAARLFLDHGITEGIVEFAIRCIEKSQQELLEKALQRCLDAAVPMDETLLAVCCKHQQWALIPLVVKFGAKLPTPVAFYKMTLEAMRVCYRPFPYNAAKSPYTLVAAVATSNHLPALVAMLDQGGGARWLELDELICESILSRAIMAKCSVDVVLLLLSRGAHINASTLRDGAPLDAACTTGNGPIVKLLLALNAKPHFNRTCSTQYHSSQLEAMLREAQARKESMRHVLTLSQAQASVAVLSNSATLSNLCRRTLYATPAIRNHLYDGVEHTACDLYRLDDLPSWSSRIDGGTLKSVRDSL
ncbi:hypothetical protein CAOG_03323 [Capsaspora owczarzaki ATCC 30864]|uniref:Uncharacterized protein n=1 Tax=Capsaspora owczarzaki (strain ATCC 30864) TaxID=595528 RepID=A0A0D2VPE2_CAPO3|nr:hypothetical protein CAOG_03323 [Capsaspora owczarzaki ATCC 30864]KJE92337.1 hypothetical protein CAOG_003323 [Capsaspora owczarzaki ATCC 30864]|eukprot:XP_004364162.1 hypothetical protein CAOG_03323 [Capsaspora owczarzaki ATCC 30864]